MSTTMAFQLGAGDAALLEAVVDHARRDGWAQRLHDRDTGLWTGDPAVAAAIADRLGWLDAPEHFELEIPALEGFGDGIRVAGFSTAVVMGMGGSSLAPEVLHRVFGTADGYLDLRVLDSTDPAEVAARTDDLDPLQTLWVVASKSGTTTEPLAFLADAWARVEAALTAAGSHQRPGEFFVAITDPGRSLRAIPHADDLRERFLNPEDIGGRYSALTYVGLVPASLIGLDLDALLASASAMLAECREPEPRSNPGLHLGLLLGVLAREGRDKLTFVGDRTLAPFAAWAEQLIAESTGKRGVGIVPVAGEPAGQAGAYGADRVVVSLSLAGPDADDPDTAGRTALLRDLAERGTPVIRIVLDDPMDLGAEFVRWEVATAYAGAILGIDPFDQPDVEDAKERTRRVLGTRGATVVATDDEAEPLRPGEVSGTDLDAAVRAFLRDRRPPQYLGIQAFIAPTAAAEAAFERIRVAVRAATGCATTLGYGPRFLHSTGQLHKGGSATGVFLQVTADHPVDRPIPGWPYGFGRLIDAQARGDREALGARGRPVLQVHLGADAAADLGRLADAVERALGR